MSGQFLFASSSDFSFRAKVLKKFIATFRHLGLHGDKGDIWCMMTNDDKRKAKYQPQKCGCNVWNESVLQVPQLSQAQCLFNAPLHSSPIRAGERKQPKHPSFSHHLATRLHLGCNARSPVTYGYGSKNPLDRPAVIRTSGTRGLRKGAWSRGLQGAKWYDMKCLHESVARPKVTWKGAEIWNRSSKFHGLWINSLKQGRKPNNHKFLTRRYTELVVVWIGLDPGLDRPGPRIEPAFLCMLQLGRSVTRKGQQGEGSKWTPWLLGSLALQQRQLGS